MTKAERRRYIALIREQTRPFLPLPPPPLPRRFAERMFPPDRAALAGDAAFAEEAAPVGEAAAPAGSAAFMPGIRAVLFDVYGTLFCSAAGDISAGAAGTGAGCTGDLDALAREYTDSGAAEALVSYFRLAVRKAHALSKAAYPEVSAGEIWEEFPGRKIPGEEFSLRYELAVNPVYPMPGAARLLSSLKAAGLVLGIVSNAQFHTPLLFEALLGGTPEALGFSPELLIYSYCEGEAKPSPVLFEKARAALRKQGIGENETVYLGNDMRNDIYGAGQAGFRTVLFAGDRRSLRLREDDERISPLLPAAAVSCLADFEQLIRQR